MVVCAWFLSLCPVELNVACLLPHPSPSLIIMDAQWQLLPITVLERIFAYSDPYAWSQVSKECNQIARTPGVKAEWLMLRCCNMAPISASAAASSDAPVPVPVVAAPARRSGALWDGDGEDAEIEYTDDYEWNNLFLSPFDDRFQPVDRHLIPLPHNPLFLNLKVLTILNNRYPSVFQILRNCLLCHSTFWLKPEETFFCLDHGACVDYAQGWVLSRFVCDENRAFHRDAIVKLIFDYQARTDFDNRVSLILRTVLLKHRDYNLAKLLLEQNVPYVHTDPYGFSQTVLMEAIELTDLQAVELLMSLDCYHGDTSSIDHVLRYAVQFDNTLEIVELLVERYGARIATDRKIIRLCLRHLGRASINLERKFCMLRYLLDHGAPITTGVLKDVVSVVAEHDGPWEAFNILVDRYNNDPPPSIHRSCMVEWNDVLVVAIAHNNTRAKDYIVDKGYVKSNMFDEHGVFRQPLTQIWENGVGGELKTGPPWDFGSLPSLITAGSTSASLMPLEG